MVKAVFFDIDGTLVSFKTHEVPQSTVEAIAALRAKGIKVFIASGRQLQSINNLGTLEFDGYVTVNGGICFAGKTEMIFKQAIPEEDIRSLLNYQREVEPFPCAFVMNGKILLNYKNKDVEDIFRLLDFPEPPIGPTDLLAGESIYQLIAFFSAGQEERIMAALPHCEATRWNPLFTDVVPKGCNKAVGIDKMLAHFGILPDEAMAFGDGGNDRAMLSHVGIGVAMGNADKEVQEAASYVTTSVDDNGIWNALKHFGLL